MSRHNMFYAVCSRPDRIDPSKIGRHIMDYWKRSFQEHVIEIMHRIRSNRDATSLSRYGNKLKAGCVSASLMDI
ncbi:hypothetical protein BC443_16720 [Salinicola sp. MIT1003]|nr:hypothetical protein BC443_16720 [Salinicola sp. MIT1003]